MPLNNKKVLGIIVARQGSKRIPHKNMRMVCGRPLIYYTIKAAKASRYLDELILSSDDKNIIKYAKKQGLEVPFVRPKYLATDNASSAAVAIHAVNYLKKHKYQIFDYICLLEPTSPLRGAGDIDKAIKKLAYSDYDSLISLVPSPCHSPYRARYIKNAQVKPAFKREFIKYSKNKKHYKRAYIPGGGIFCCKENILLRKKILTAGKAMPYIIKKYRGIDINEPDDLFLAESLLKSKLIEI